MYLFIKPRYLHGSPFKTRKVVFDKKIYEQIQNSSNPLSPSERMKECPQERFKILGEHIDQARLNDEKVLVFLFSHGIETSLDFSYYDWRSEIPEVPDIKSMVKALVRGETKYVGIMVAAPSPTEEAGFTILSAFPEIQ